MTTRILLVGLALGLPACAEPDPPSVPRMVASCELEGVRLYRNPATRDERVGEYIVTCMRAKGYAISFLNTPCAATPNLRDPACYQPASP